MNPFTPGHVLVGDIIGHAFVDVPGFAANPFEGYQHQALITLSVFYRYRSVWRNVFNIKPRGKRQQQPFTRTF